MAGVREKAQEMLKGWRLDLLACLIIVSVTALNFGHALTHEFLINWDDALYVVGNETVRGITPANLKAAFSSFYVGNYAPLQMISYMVDYSLWGLTPGGFIFSNLLLHAINGTLFYTLLRKVHGKQVPALAGALLFVMHPVQVETVVWISQRKSLLAVTFFLIAILCYRRWRESSDASFWSYAAAFSAFILAILSKSVTFVLPLVLLVYDRCYRGDGRRVGTVAALLPFLAASGVAAVLALISQSQGLGGGRVSYHGGSPWATALTMMTVMVEYLRLIFWPTNLSAVYEPRIRTGVDGAVLLSVAVIILVAGGVWFLVRRKPRDMFWVSLIFFGLLPVSQIVPLVTLMNDRYLYLPMLGIAGLLCSSISDGVSRLSFVSRYALFGAYVACFIFLSVMTVKRTRVWQDALTLWSDAVEKEPASYTTWFGLGEALFRKGNLGESEAAFLQALAIRPGDVAATTNLEYISRERQSRL